MRSASKASAFAWRSARSRLRSSFVEGRLSRLSNAANSCCKRRTAASVGSAGCENASIHSCRRARLWCQRAIRVSRRQDNLLHIHNADPAALDAPRGNGRRRCIVKRLQRFKRIGACRHYVVPQACKKKEPRCRGSFKNVTAVSSWSSAWCSASPAALRSGPPVCSADRSGCRQRTAGPQPVRRQPRPPATCKWIRLREDRDRTCPAANQDRVADRYAAEMNVTVLVDFVNDSVGTALEVATRSASAWGASPDTSGSARRPLAAAAARRGRADRRRSRARAPDPRGRSTSAASHGGQDRRLGRLHRGPDPRLRGRRRARGRLRRRLLADPRRERLHRRRGDGRRARRTPRSGASYRPNDRPRAASTVSGTKRTRSSRGALHVAVRAPAVHEVLVAPLHRRDQAAAGGELVDQRRGDRVQRRGGDVDGVVGRGLGPALRAVADRSVTFSTPSRRERRGGARRTAPGGPRSTSTCAASRASRAAW